MEHRWGERVQVDFPVRLTAHRFSVTDGRLTELSVSGALVEADFEARVLSRIRIAIVLPLWPKHQSPTVEAYVARKFKGQFGIEWCEFKPQAINRLLQTSIARHYRRKPDGRTPGAISRRSAPLLKPGD